MALTFHYDFGDVASRSMTGAYCTAIAGQSGLGPTVNDGGYGGYQIVTSPTGRQCVSFTDGSGYTAALPANFTSSTVTLCVAYRFTSPRTWARILSLANTGSDWQDSGSLMFVRDNERIPSVNKGNGGGSQSAVFPDVSYEDAWNVVTYTIGPAGATTIRVNGTVVKTGTLDMGGGVLAGRIGIGAQASGGASGDSFRGEIGELKLWDSVLSGPEILEQEALLKSRWVSPVHDNFNRGDGALAAPWVTIDGSHSIVGNKVPVGPASPNVSYYNETFAADQWAEVDASSLNLSGSMSIPAVRITAGGDFYYFWTTGGVVTINKRVGGSYSQVGAAGPAMPTTLKARLEAEGTTLRAYVNGALALTVTDTSIATGKPGILSANGAGASLDNFRAGDLSYTDPIYTDDFNRADASSLGPNWTQTNAQIHIKSQHLWMDTSGCSNMYSAAAFPATSHWSEGVMRIQDGQEGSIGPSVRQGSGENSYYAWIRGTVNPPTFEIWRQWLGTYAQIGGLSSPVPAAKTGPVLVAVEVDGLTIRGYVEGVKVIEWVEDNPTNAPTGTAPGVNGGLFGAAQDPVQMDDWRGGPGLYPGPVAEAPTISGPRILEDTVERTTEAGVTRSLEAEGATAGPSEGSATVTWVETLAAAGTKAPKGAATTTHTWVPAAVGKRTPKAAATTSWTMACAAVGKETPKATATTTWTEALAAVGKRTPKGSLTTTWVEALAAVGKRAPLATALTTWVEALSVLGKRTPKSTITTSHTWVPAAVGAKPVVGMKQGAGTTQWTATCSVVGKRAPKATATTTYTEAVTAAGKKIQNGVAGAISWVMAVAAAGKRTPKGAATVPALQTIAATGKRDPKGAATTGFFIYNLTAQGVTPAVGVKQGSGIALTMWATDASGKRTPKGGNTTAHLWATAAVGKKTQKGVASTSYTEVVAAAGKRIAKSVVTLSYLAATAAVGKRAPKGVASPANHSWTMTAQGSAPLVGYNKGSGLATTTWAPAAVGKRTPKGSNSVAVTFAISATGKKFQQATAATTYLWQPSAAGKKLSNSAAVVTHVWALDTIGHRQPKARGDTDYWFSQVALGLEGLTGTVEAIWNGEDVVAMQYGDKMVIEWLMIPA